jgi:hypothetical protein
MELFVSEILTKHDVEFLATTDFSFSQFLAEILDCLIGDTHTPGNTDPNEKWRRSCGVERSCDFNEYLIMSDQSNEPLQSSFTYNQALEFIISQNRRQEEQLQGIVKRKSRLKAFKVTTDAVDDEAFVVGAGTVNSACNRAIRKVGTRQRVIVDGGDRLLTSVPTIE